MKILVVDDEAVLRLMLAKSLEALGHEPVAVEDGELAWATFQCESFQVVLTDWMMPGTSGIELCRRIRAHPKNLYTYIIIITQLGGKARYLEGMAAGADDFLNKPVDMGDLLVRLRVAERIVTLQSELSQLQGLIPICMYCRRIRSSDNDWKRLEAYIEQHSDARFTHGICPECKCRFTDAERSDHASD